MNRQPIVAMVLAGFAILIVPLNADAAQYTAYSMRVAQARIEAAEDNWRASEKDLLNLAGINKVDGFVFDTESGDLILVGRHEAGRAELTLDDLVVALRARFRYNQEPLVSIDPMPDTEKTQMQQVRFEGGIPETAFGQALFDADYRLKQMGLGVKQPGIEGVRTYWDRNIEEVESGAISGERQVNSRFWFYPINPRIVIREDVCVVRGLRVGVFTEVMAARIDGKPIEDIRRFRDATGDAFAKDVSDRFDDLCKTQPSFNRLRGLQDLVGVSRALQELDELPDLRWWLEKYPLARVKTLKEVKVLRRKHDGQRGWLEVSGGVHLTALARRLKAGDVTALREAVIGIRPSHKALTWGFVVDEWVIPIPNSSSGSKDMDRESAAEMYAHGFFLFNHRQYDLAIAYWRQVARSYPGMGEIYYHIGRGFEHKGMLQVAADYYTKALGADSSFKHFDYQRKPVNSNQ